MYADAIVMPVCNSLFDRESASDCLAELRRLPRVASGRCRLAAIGMRVEPGSDGHLVLQRWANERQLAFIAALRESRDLRPLRRAGADPVRPAAGRRPARHGRSGSRSWTGCGRFSSQRLPPSCRPTTPASRRVQGSPRSRSPTSRGGDSARPSPAVRATPRRCGPPVRRSVDCSVRCPFPDSFSGPSSRRDHRLRPTRFGSFVGAGTGPLRMRAILSCANSWRTKSTNSRTRRGRCLRAGNRQ